MPRNKMQLHEPIEGLKMTQNPYIDHAFMRIKDIDCIIEIGTEKGGFAVWLRSMFPDAVIHTWDIKEKDQKTLRHKLFKKHVINFHLKDVFDDIDYIKELIGIGKTMILCDGGDKISEFTTFGNYLKKGDLIGAHDYGIMEAWWHKNIKEKIWNSLEIRWGDIRDFCTHNRLKPLHEDIFQKAVWIICEKI